MIDGRDRSIRIIIFFIQGDAREQLNKSTLNDQMVYLSQASWSDEIDFPIFPGKDTSSPFHFFFMLNFFQVFHSGKNKSTFDSRVRW